MWVPVRDFIDRVKAGLDAGFLTVAKAGDGGFDYVRIVEAGQDQVLFRGRDRNPPVGRRSSGVLWISKGRRHMSFSPGMKCLRGEESFMTLARGRFTGLWIRKTENPARSSV